MYCKWLLRGEGKKYSLSLDVLNMNLFPVTADCLHDGVVIYHKVEGKQTVYGKTNIETLPIIIRFS